MRDQRIEPAGNRLDVRAGRRRRVGGGPAGKVGDPRQRPFQPRRSLGRVILIRQVRLRADDLEFQPAARFKVKSEPGVMLLHQTVIVHGLAEARAALRPGWPVTLLSARGAALHGGCLWWRELVAAARARHPATPVLDVLDCADAPGQAMAALRIGQRLLLLDAACPAFPAVAAAAAVLGAAVLDAPPAALDLGNPAARRRLAGWLAASRKPAQR